MSEPQNDPVATAPGTDLITHEIDLTGGYTDAKRVTHRHVVFGKSVTAKRLLGLRLDPQATLQTQYQDLLLAESIVEFGTLKMPVALPVLLKLNTVDRDDLMAGRDAYRAKVIGDRKQEFNKNGVTLLFGIKIGEIRYTIVEFGKDVTGYDEVAADRNFLTELLARKAFLAGRMITKISNAEGNSIEGPIEYETIASDDLDEDDLFVLVSASELWRQSFRIRRAAVSKDKPAEAGGDPGGEV
jgi:hypothetical protein